MKVDNIIILKENGFNVPNFDVIKWNDRNKEIDISKYHGKYAIRSSAYIEDGKTDSFAGQFDTYLNIKAKDIKEYVKKCFESINNDNVKKYIAEKNINVDSIKMDVIIQEMVESDISGVLFSSNPQGIINETVISVGEGLGNNVVEDKGNTTTYYYNNTDKIFYFEGKKNLLTEEIIEDLLNQTNKIKELFGNFIDVEFSIKNNKIYFLQVRPITTINDKKFVILDNSNIVESYPGVSLPLTISFVKLVYSNVFEKEAYRLSKNKKLVDSCNKQFQNMVGTANGRIYYKISNWYTLIKFLPFSKKIIPIWQDMLGVKNKSYDKEEIKIPFFTRAQTYFNTYHELKKVTKNMEKLNAKFNEVNDFFYSNFKDNIEIEEVIKLYNLVKDELLSCWDITLVNDLYSFIFTGALKNRLKKKGYSIDVVNSYISGISNIESLKPIKKMIEIAYKKDEYSIDEYEKEKENYIKIYGDRNLEELKLESKTFRTNPELLEEKISEYRKDMVKLNKIYEELNEEPENKNEVKEDFITRYLSKRAKKGVENREISRLNRSRIYGMVRAMFLAISDKLVELDKIENKEDIFYLSIEEIFNYEKYDLKKLIGERKNDYSIYYELPNYSRLVFLDHEFDKNHKKINNVLKSLDKDTLVGTPSSNGYVKGEALVITDIRKKYDIKDKILITKMTDPGWVFMIASAKGIISEKGSILSHTAIISRELKIPSIVGVDNATNIIKTGDYIELDANKGNIKIIERGK